MQRNDWPNKGFAAVAIVQLLFVEKVYTVKKKMLSLNIKSISFIVLTQFFHFNELNILRQTRLLHFFKLNQQYFLQCNYKNMYVLH